ncbi:hypothetical protein J3Q64DRAFT_1771686 [Phycomyces blakesleeanus]|uniref:F-box domain-containing protein n=2 Tax=Phycomyces blakesleeanus TaxID=4837 RepID=A0A167JAK8_PHYB8|nr:hypothetical protein PHYBLDRAFT_184128 [Phycomyces blakesleeanus NRRL 1555(-)]OAD65608.1 hypothetical protein PHYBLDRAFT_184128 [Phycomyces blakesleeanus NRRL 1555(-)]|eukprot:XP_018283648.1 hypothetical protein PHYBLDRAFT_184128 [Phycomyces blakesleeanus NRRL 1555(-)]
MSASNLPFEILNRIAFLLKKSDQVTCSTVCQSWYSPFLLPMWTEVKITSRRPLLSLIKTISSSNKHGQLIRSLSVLGNARISEKELNIFQRACPGLQCLSIEKYAYDAREYDFPLDWHLWRSLTELSLRLDHWDMDEMVLIVSGLPGLKSLSIQRDSRINTDIFNLDNMEIIHSCLPMLETLSLDCGLKVLSNSELAYIFTLPVSKSITSLTATLKTSNHAWIYYWTHKYPNLTNIKWRTESDHVGQLSYDYLLIEDTETDNAIREAFRLAGRCLSNLETVSFHERVCPYLPYYELFKGLSETGTSLKNIEYSLNLNENIPTPSTILLKTICQSSLQTLEHFKFTITGPVSDALTIPSLLHFRNLRSLSLKGFGAITPISFDALLNACPCVETLDLKSVVLSLQSSVPLVSERHVLRSLVLDYLDTDSNMFSYISRRCRQLTYMRLTYVKVTDPLFSDTHIICIDMPYTHFKMLLLDEVFFLSHKEYHPTARARVNLFAISQVNVRSEPPPSSSLHPFNPSTRWYHSYTVYRAYRNGIRYRLLDPSDVSWIQTYLESIESVDDYPIDRYNGSDEDNRPKDDNGCVHKENWERDIPHGYVDLRCGSVGIFRTDEYFSLGDPLKENIYNIQY